MRVFWKKSWPGLVVGVVIFLAMSLIYSNDLVRKEAGELYAHRTYLAMQGRSDGIEHGRVELAQYFRSVLSACDPKTENLKEVFTVLWRASCAGVKRQHQLAWQGYIPSDVSWLQTRTGWSRAEIFEAMHLIESRASWLDSFKSGTLAPQFVSRIIHAYQHPEIEPPRETIRQISFLGYVFLTWIILSWSVMFVYIISTSLQGDLEDRRYLGWKWYKPWVWFVCIFLIPGWIVHGAALLVAWWVRRTFGRSKEAQAVPAA